MKRIILYSAAAVLCCINTLSCTKNTEPASIVINTSELVIDSAGERTTIGVKSNRDWEATSDASWLTLTPSSAEAFEASSYIIVEAVSNEGEERSATITVMSKSGDASASVKVIQGENGLIIKTGKEFAEYLQLVASGNATNEYKLGRDISLKDITLPEIEDFSYALDCQGHSISDWTTSRSLFNRITASGSLMNLVIDGSCSLTVPDNAVNFGFIAQVNEGTVQNIENRADIAVNAITAGKKGAICGVNKGYMSGCANYGNMTYSGDVHSADGAYYSGVAGQTDGENARIENCTNEGNISFTFNGVLTRSFYASGVVGAVNNNSKAIGCTNSGDVTVASAGNTTLLMAGGIVTYAGGEVADCTNNGAISYYAESAEGKADGGVKGTGVAGIACYEGWGNGTVRNNTNTGAVTLRAGYSLGCQASGSASKYATNVAGVFGHMYNCAVENCRNSGTVTSILADIDNEAAVHAVTNDNSKNFRQSAGGIVASSWGAVTGCENTGEINVTWTTSLPEEGVARSSVNIQFIAQVGGISGGDYHSDQGSSPIRNSINSGNINYVCDARGSNNSLGGIAGWPNKEGAAAESIIEMCENTGTITADGYGKTRIGGISGGAAKHKDKTNSRRIFLKNGYSTCTIGGIAGVMAGPHTINGCESYGEIASDVKLAGKQGGSDAALGGIVGASFNQGGTTLNGCTVNCGITAPEGSTAFLIAGVVGSNKNVTTENTFGTEESPNIISGGFLTLGSARTDITAENYATYAFPWGTGSPVNENISYKITFIPAL